MDTVRTQQQLDSFIREIPKVELHVHLEGSIPPETLLELARRNNVSLPVDTPSAIAKWYTFKDFPHFADVYHTSSKCIRSADDIELLAKDFIKGQAAQNIVYTEFTFTALTHYQNYDIPFDAQLAALDRARRWAEGELDVSFGVIVDIPRDTGTPEEGVFLAEWLADSWGETIVAMGLGGYEIGFPPEMFKAAFDITGRAGVPAVIHAGETDGPASIWGALRELGAVRIGHGVRCLEDPELVKYLRSERILLEVCPSSNVCLGVVPSLAEHPLPRLVESGLVVTVNSDDPPMFATTYTDEFLRVTRQFGFTADDVSRWQRAAAAGALGSPEKRRALVDRIDRGLEAASGR
ncbi:MAG: adenosine deaminase [Spirochaetales bacterium]|nr:adenosine deaminase [Spirochaetales bacterium]